jgi:hypothetical protein
VRRQHACNSHCHPSSCVAGFKLLTIENASHYVADGSKWLLDIDLGHAAPCHRPLCSGNINSDKSQAYGPYTVAMTELGARAAAGSSASYTLADGVVAVSNTRASARPGNDYGDPFKSIAFTGELWFTSRQHMTQAH